MEAMWNQPDVQNEWVNAGEIKGQKVHMSRDPDGQPYLTQTEMIAVAHIIARKHYDSTINPAVAEITVLKHFSREVNPGSINFLPLAILCNSFRRDFFVPWQRLIACILWMDMGKRLDSWGLNTLQPPGFIRSWATEVEYGVDLVKPFVSMYFGAAYCAWLSRYEGRERNLQFVLPAYFCSPNNVNNSPEMAMGTTAAMIRLTFEQALNHYGEHERDQGSYNFM